MFVVDASITLAWCFEDAMTTATEAVLERLVLEGGIAPAHWPLEVANGLRFAWSSGRVTDGSWATMEAQDVRDPAEVDPERDWNRGHVYVCPRCAESVRLSVPAGEAEAAVQEAG